MISSDNTPLSRSDTGLWHLTVNISDRGVSASIDRRDAPQEPPRTLMDVSWPPEYESLMRKIESAIYDHPEVLDDYSATIVIDTPRTLMVPKELITDDAEAERIYAIAYKGRAEDVMSDLYGDEGVLFTLCPGMISFLRRTFPGARIRSRLGMRIQRARSVGVGLRIFVEGSAGDAAIICLKGDTLLSASLQPWGEWADLAYKIVNLSDLYGFSLAGTSLFLSLPPDAAADLENFFSARVASVSCDNPDNL